MESNTLLAFLKKASEDDGLHKELVALAGRYGIPLGSDELSDASLDQVAGGLLQTTLNSNLLGGQRVGYEPDQKRSVGNVAKLCDGSV